MMGVSLSDTTGVVYINLLGTFFVYGVLIVAMLSVVVISV